MRFRYGYCEVEFPGTAAPATLPMFRFSGYDGGEEVWARVKGRGRGSKAKGQSVRCSRGPKRGADPRDAKASARDGQGEARACAWSGKRGLSGAQRRGEERKREGREASEGRTASGQPCARRRRTSS